MNTITETYADGIQPMVGDIVKTPTGNYLKVLEICRQDIIADEREWHLMVTCTGPWAGRQQAIPDTLELIRRAQ